MRTLAGAALHVVAVVCDVLAIAFELVAMVFDLTAGALVAASTRVKR